MLKSKESYAYDLGENVQEIMNDVIEGYSPPSAGRSEVEYEDEITGAISSRIGTSLTVDSDNYAILPDTHNGVTEEETGADLAILYNVDTVDISLQTGVLMQAKRYESGYYNAENNDWSKLVDQCEKMLKYSTDSYVIDYSMKENGVYLIPAVSVAGTSSSTLDDFDNDAWLPQKYHRRKPGEVIKPLFLGFLGSEYVYQFISKTEDNVPDFRRTNDLEHPDPIYADGAGEVEEERQIQIVNVTVKDKDQ